MVSRSRGCIGATLVGWLVAIGACFDPTAELRGKPCTGDDSCGDLRCDYGFCGGPSRCPQGASVGEYCFALSDETFPTAGAAAVMTVGRVDLDPFTDVVTVAADGRASLLLNDGSGGLAMPIGAPAMGAPSGVGIGDVDGVGWHELVISTVDGRVVVAPVAEGGFAAPVVAASGLHHPLVPTVANFYADLQGGVPDLAVLVGDGMDVVPQAGALAFDTPVHTEIDEPSDLATLSADGARALVARASQNDVEVLERTLDGKYAAVATIEVGGSPARIVHADLDGDDYPDILAATHDGGLWLTTSKTASPQSSDDWAQPKLVYQLGWVPEVLAVGELDGDDALELVVAGTTPSGGSDVFLFDNDGDGRPIYGGSLGVVDGTAVAMGELDGDGVPEIVVAGSSPAAVRIARRTVAPPPPGTATTGDTGTMPGTGPDTLDTGSSDPTLDPSVDPSDAEIGEETLDPGCNGYPIDFLCYAVVDRYAHGMATVTGLVELRALESVFLLGTQLSKALEEAGAIVPLQSLGVAGSYELGMSSPLPEIPSGGDAGFLLDGAGVDLVITSANGMLVFSQDESIFVLSAGANAREPAITDIGDDALGDVVTLVDSGIALVRGSAIADAFAGNADAQLEIFELGELSDFDALPLIGTSGALGIAARPQDSTVAAIAFDLGNDGLEILTGLPGEHARYTGFGRVAGELLQQSFLVAANVDDADPLVQLALAGFGDEWNVSEPVGSAFGLAHDFLVVDFDYDGSDDLIAMFDDGMGNRDVRVLLWRGDYFEPVVSLTDVPDAQHMIAVDRGTNWDILVVTATDVVVFSQVFNG